MLRICLIGPGNIKFHFNSLLGMSDDEFEKHIEGIAGVLREHEIVLLPDRGVSFEIAKRYKELKGKKVIATIPLKDKDFGIKHLEKYINYETNGTKLFDKQIDTGDWYKQHMTLCLFGEVIFMLGNSLGSLAELSCGFYLYKLLVGDKPEVKAKIEKINTEIMAGINKDFAVIIYSPFMKEKLPEEIESYIKKSGGKVIYADNPEAIKLALQSLHTSS